jgi:hypothetical protein
MNDEFHFPNRTRGDFSLAGEGHIGGIVYGLTSPSATLEARVCRNTVRAT